MQAARRGAAHLGALVRWKEWRASKLPLYLAALCYAALQGASLGAVRLLDMALLAALFCLYASFGHLVNDYSDLEADRSAGKRRALASWSRPAALAMVVAFAAATALVAVVRFDAGTVALTGLALLLAAIYSLPPLRLKERGISGWVAAALAQRTLPFAIAFQALGAWDWAAAAWCLLGALIGLRFILTHQILDRRSDLRAGVRTMATRHGAATLRGARTRWLLPLEAATLGAVVLAMAASLPAVPIAAAGYAAWRWIRRRREETLSWLVQDALEDFYSFLWPALLAAALALRDPLYLAVLALVLALQHGRLAALLRKPAAAGNAPRREEVRLDKANPYPFYAGLRARAAAHPVVVRGLGSLWLVARYQDALTVFKDPRFVKNRNRVPARGFGPDMVELDPPDHTRLRALVSKAFTSRFVERLEQPVQRLADQLLDRAQAQGGMELIAGYASVIPITVIGSMLGVPIANLGRFRAFTYALSLGPGARQAQALAAEKLQFEKHLKAVIAARRAQPRDDLISALVKAEQESDRLSADELLGMAYLLLVAGYMTTVNLIGNATLALLRHPEPLDLLRRDPARLEPAIEELLRFDAPLELSSPYFAAADLELSGTRIPRGAQVRVIIPSANRDEGQFPRPDVLDITRDARHHLAFGQGIHYCLGAPLARLEGRIALRTLLARMPGLRLGVTPEQVVWQRHPVLRGLKALPVRF